MAQPAGSAPHPRAFTISAALAAGVLVAFVMPIAYLVVPILAGNCGRNGVAISTSVVILALIGGALWIGALALAIVAVVRAHRASRSQAAAWTTLGLRVVALFTGAVAWLVGLFFGSGGGP